MCSLELQNDIELLGAALEAADHLFSSFFTLISHKFRGCAQLLLPAVRQSTSWLDVHSCEQSINASTALDSRRCRVLQRTWPELASATCTVRSLQSAIPCTYGDCNQLWSFLGNVNACRSASARTVTIYASSTK
eukprot:7192-Heterococcus_DN1.PRE.2